MKCLHVLAGADPNLRDWSGRKPRQYQASQDTSVSADTFRSEYLSNMMSKIKLPTNHPSAANNIYPKVQKFRHTHHSLLRKSFRRSFRPKSEDKHRPQTTIPAYSHKWMLLWLHGEGREAVGVIVKVTISWKGMLNLYAFCWGYHLINIFHTKYSTASSSSLYPKYFHKIETKTNLSYETCQRIMLYYITYCYSLSKDIILLWMFWRYILPRNLERIPSSPFSLLSKCMCFPKNKKHPCSI
jgi:hypothetical protein